MASGGNEDEITEEMLDFCGNLFEFAEACKRDSKWELIFKRGEEGEIYRRPEGGIYQYLVVGKFNDMDYQRFVLAQHDLKYRKEWDQHTISCETIEENVEDQSSTIYWLVKYPWPLANRDYVFRQRLRLSADHQHYVACKRACAHPSKKAHSSPVRVVTYRCDVLAQSTEDGGVRYCTLYSDDPGGSIPSSIVNWAIKTAVPKYFDDIPGIVSKWQGRV